MNDLHDRQTARYGLGYRDALRRAIAAALDADDAAIGALELDDPADLAGVGSWVTGHAQRAVAWAAVADQLVVSGLDDLEPEPDLEDPFDRADLQRRVAERLLADADLLERTAGGDA